MAPKKIASPLFKGTDSLSHDQWRELEVVSPTDGPRRLMQNWAGTIMGYLCCRLDNENRRILDLNFHLLGIIFDEDGISMNCNKFWDTDSEGITLQINPFDSKAFQFKSGTLVSDLLDSSAIDISWYQDGVPILETDPRYTSLPGFCLRFYAMPVQPTWASMLYPLAKADLLKSDEF